MWSDFKSTGILLAIYTILKNIDGIDAGVLIQRETKVNLPEMCYNNNLGSNSDNNNNYRGQCFTGVSRLGNGYFGTVVKAKSRVDGCWYALKQISLDDGRNEYPHLELEAWTRIHPHPNVNSLVSAWTTEDYWYGSSQWFQSPLCLMDLRTVWWKTRTSSAKESMLWCALVDMLRALEHINAKGLVYVDLKAEHILLCGVDNICTDNDRKNDQMQKRFVFKLIDFSMAFDWAKKNRAMTRWICSIARGGYFWEHLSDTRGWNCDLSPATDVAILGTVLLELALGENGLREFWLSTNKHKFLGEHKFEFKPSPELFGVLVSMVDDVPGKRPSAGNLLRSSIVQRHTSECDQNMFNRIVADSYSYYNRNVAE